MNSQLAYIAGMLDGEGSLCVGKYPRKGNRYLGYRAYMCIANTYVPVLEFIKSIIGGKIVEQGKGSGCYSLTLTTNEIRRWLPELLNHLIVKKNQAEVLLAFLERQANNSSAPISDELLNFYESCYQKLKELKKIRFKFKEPVISLGLKKCFQCGTEFELNSRYPKKKFCSIICRHTNHMKKSNERIRAGIQAWSSIN